MTTPIPMILFCPSCHARHLDEGEFATKAHVTHACQSCGFCWKPSTVDTVGVQFLPGCRNDPSIVAAETGIFPVKPDIIQAADSADQTKRERDSAVIMLQNANLEISALQKLLEETRAQKDSARIWFAGYNAAHYQLEGFKIKPNEQLIREVFDGHLTVGCLKAGDCFKWKTPPAGWSSGNMIMMDQHPGFAMPDGWDFFLTGILDNEIERVDRALIDQIRETPPDMTEILNDRSAKPDHAYLSAGNNPYADGDRAYTGCSLCGRSRSEHSA